MTGPNVGIVKSRLTPTVGDLRRALADTPDDQPLTVTVRRVQSDPGEARQSGKAEVTDVDARSWGATIRVEVEL